MRRWGVHQLGVETAKKFSKADIEHALTELDGGKYGMIPALKGYRGRRCRWLAEFDYVPASGKCVSAVPTWAASWSSSAPSWTKGHCRTVWLLSCKLCKGEKTDYGKRDPVYLFVGFLESGKTKFIQETFEDPNFDSGDKTLLLVCEEGEEKNITRRNSPSLA